jgi:hypothetical protein
MKTRRIAEAGAPMVRRIAMSGALFHHEAAPSDATMFRAATATIEADRE